jgi:hypothetical protein
MILVKAVLQTTITADVLAFDPSADLAEANEARQASQAS